MGGGIEYNYLIDVGVSKEQLVIVPDQPSAVEALRLQGHWHFLNVLCKITVFKVLPLSLKNGRPGLPDLRSSGFALSSFCR